MKADEPKVVPQKPPVGIQILATDAGQVIIRATGTVQGGQDERITHEYGLSPQEADAMAGTLIRAAQVARQYGKGRAVRIERPIGRG